MVKYFSYSLIASVVLAALYLWDASSRYENIAFCPTPKEIKAFNSGNHSGGSLKKVYQAHFFDRHFSFPRQKVHRITIIKNIPFISRFTSVSLSKEQIPKILTFLNNPDNFSWQQPSMIRADADYILYFYNNKNQAIGKLWLCTSCGQFVAVPFSPNMKFGCIKPSKNTSFQKLLNI